MSVRVRPVASSDAAAMRAFHDGLSPAGAFSRFFPMPPRLSERSLERLTSADHNDRVVMVAELGERLVAAGRCDRVADTDQADVAIVVADDQRGAGLELPLLSALAEAAARNGVLVLTAQVLAKDAIMLAAYRSTGFPLTQTLEGGTIDLHLLIAPGRDQSTIREAHTSSLRIPWS